MSSTNLIFICNCQEILRKTTNVNINLVPAKFHYERFQCVKLICAALI